MAKKRPFEILDGAARDRVDPKHMIIRRLPLFRRAPPRTARNGPSLATLVEAVARDERGSANALFSRRRDPKFRAAVVTLTGRSTRMCFAVEKVLSAYGGRGSKAALLRAVRAYARSTKTFDADTTWSSQAQLAASVASSLLGLDRDADEAAVLLVRLFEHPRPYIRMWSVWQASDLFRLSYCHTVAFERIADALRPMVAHREDEVFIKAVPALWTLARNPKDLERVKRRCTHLLHSPDPHVRTSVLSRLLEIPSPLTTGPLIGEWFTHERWLRNRVRWTALMPWFVEESTRRNLCRRGLAHASPSLRHDAIELLVTITPAAQKKLLATALRDEPDPHLAAEMVRVLGRVSRHRSRSEHP